MNPTTLLTGSMPAVAAPYWKIDPHGELLVGGIPVSEIVRDQGTPAFVYDREILEQKYQALRQALPQSFAISYSVKANPNPAFLKFFLSKGAGLEIASAGEFHQSISAGCPPQKIVFAGPGKTEAELEMVIAQDIGEIHAESSLEIERISTISQRLGSITSVAVRVNPTEEGQGGAMRMGGKPAPFGVDEERLDPLLERIVGDAHLRFTGIHLFVGTQILDYKLLLTQYENGLDIARHAAQVTRLPVHTLDFGGGLGIPYFPGESELDLAKLKDGLAKLFAPIKDEPCFSQTKFMLEPGRFLVGECGVYVTKINDIKISRGKKFLILDGGMNHHLAASGNFGQIIKRNFPIAVLNKLNSEATETVDVVGPLCTPLDTLGRSVPLPATEVGDLVGIFQSGAYARSASPLGFLSHVTPPEVWVENKQRLLIRRRGLVEDYLRDAQPLQAAE
jgi:diaminopimelate decarboxylase